MVNARPRSARFSFLAKAAVALALIALADFLAFDSGGVGWTLGLFALAWTAAVALAMPAARSRAAPLAWLAGAAAFGAILVDDPSLLAWTLFWVCLSVAVLLPRLAQPDNALGMGLRLVLHWMSSAIAAPMDMIKLPRLSRSKRRRRGIRSLLSLVAKCAHHPHYPLYLSLHISFP